MTSPMSLSPGQGAGQGGRLVSTEATVAPALEDAEQFAAQRVDLVGIQARNKWPEPAG